MNETKTINVFVKSGSGNLMKAIKKTNRKIKGLKGGLIALSIFCGYLAAELAERKRSENWLNNELEELKAKIEEKEVSSKSNTDGGDADA